jgi:hypothetical protein
MKFFGVVWKKKKKTSIGTYNSLLQQALLVQKAIQQK